MSQERNAGNGANQLRNERNWRENAGGVAEMRHKKRGDG